MAEPRRYYVRSPDGRTILGLDAEEAARAATRWRYFCARPGRLSKWERPAPVLPWGLAP